MWGKISIIENNKYEFFILNKYKRVGKMENKKAIVVIGDWFIDENWLVSRQKVYHSSHTGDIHYRARNEELDKQIISLCGTAELFEVLRSYFNNNSENNKNYQFYGLGVWNPMDNDVMKCSLCNKIDYGILTPSTLMGPINQNQENGNNCPYSKKEQCKSKLNLINLASGDKNSTKFSTSRIVRCYEGFRGGKPHLLYRFDWILPLSPDFLDYAKPMEQLVESNETGEKNIEAVVIEDHGMGVINEKCIEELSEHVNNNTKWFIRTKKDNPPWFRVLKEKKLFQH